MELWQVEPERKRSHWLELSPYEQQEEKKYQLLPSCHWPTPAGSQLTQELGKGSQFSQPFWYKTEKQSDLNGYKPKINGYVAT